MPEIFISYTREDQAEARRFAEAFKGAGYTVWWDTALHAGEAFDLRIEAAIKAAKVVVVLWSEKSVTSRWVRAEAVLADRLQTLVPVRIRACELPIMFELTHTAELSDWDGSPRDAAWQTLLEDMNQVAARASNHLTPAVPAAPDTASQRTPSSTPSVLVLPFVNMSGDPDQEYFSDGVSEDIITDLGKVAALSVISRRTAFSYKNKTLSAAAAQDLQVGYILEGSVRKSGNRVRITAQLLDAASDAQIWGERYDRTLDDIFAIQDEISEAIVSALKITLAPKEKQAIEKRTTTNSEAYELFVMARQFSRRGSERMQPIIERICLKVVELDPGFAGAFALMAFAQADMHQRNIMGVIPDGGLAAAQRAITLDPGLAEGHAALAEVLGRGDDYNVAVGEPHIRRALELDPECYEANLFAGYIVLATQRYGEAIAYFEKAAALDPVAYRPAGMVVQAYAGLGDTQKVLAAARRCLARCETLLAIEPDHSGALGFLVTSLATLGETERAETWARRAILFHPDSTRLHYNLACGFAEAGNADRALEILQGVIVEVTGGWLSWIGSDNSFDPIRDDPRFKTMIEDAKARFKSDGEVD